MNYTLKCSRCGYETTHECKLAEHGNWPACPHCRSNEPTMEQQMTAVNFISDIPAYRAIAADNPEGIAHKAKSRPYIGGRRQHREFVKRNRYVELGNEQPKEKKPEYAVDTEPRWKMRRDIKLAIDEVKGRRGYGAE